MRVWDRFLTEQDHKHLAAGWKKTEPFGLGQRPVLIVVDDVVAILGQEPEPLLEGVRKFRFRMGVDAWGAVEKTMQLVDAARRNSVQVISTTLTRPHPWVPFRSPEIVAEFARGADFVSQVAPLPTELVIHKVGASGFLGTSLLSHLIANRVDTVLVCGNSTSGCVRATVVDAACYGFLTAVVEECTFDRTEASHAMSLFDMDQKYADVISLGAAMAYLDRVTEGEPEESIATGKAWASAAPGSQQ
jgi:maleamate amidohydrolase